ncbi:MAG TPA: hypothetical protein VKB90_15780, partial [Candidatus Acidoferrum sp.]|nr:hypothetical protein [Candidatus Acidoferrum sp.]
MKTLRLLRNIAALFIFLMALLASQPKGARADTPVFGCKPSKNATACTRQVYDGRSSCRVFACAAGSPCPYTECK